LFAHADDADIDEPLKPDEGHTLGAEDKIPGMLSHVDFGHPCTRYNSLYRRVLLTEISSAQEFYTFIKLNQEQL
jgi:hypothetical protein